VLDEAYVEFHKRSFTPLVSEYPNLLVLRTFSKAFAIAGLRVGYIVADPAAIKLLDLVKPPFSVNTLALEAAMAALDDQGYMQDKVRRIVKGREKLFEALNGKYTAFKSESNYILADVSPDKAEDVYKKLLDEKFIVRNYGRFEGFSGEYIRVSVGTETEVERFIEALKVI
jgi:histidinol-phosphate aminotransferase